MNAIIFKWMGSGPACDIRLRTTVTCGELERKVLPFGVADGAVMVSMLNSVGNAAKVKGVGALSCEDGLAQPCPDFTFPKQMAQVFCDHKQNYRL